jgi:hypothetical protein
LSQLWRGWGSLLGFVDLTQLSRPGASGRARRDSGSIRLVRQDVSGLGRNGWFCVGGHWWLLLPIVDFLGRIEGLSTASDAT